MRRWRAPLIFSAAVVLTQTVRLTPLSDVVSGYSPAALRLAYPPLHLVFAPFTLTADWLNGGSTGDLIGFIAWAVGVFTLARLLAGKPRRVIREVGAAALFLGAMALFVWWGARWPRPIPRLLTRDSTLLVFDIHSHTAASHDGRPGFDAAANAAWHLRAGFDAAFVTDHNVFGQAGAWQRVRAGRPPRLLAGEELSLSGLHMLVLGGDSLIANKPWDASFDSSLALLRAIAATAPGAARPYVVASLPEYQRDHWGADLGRTIAAGVEGLEIWTTSPKAMDFLPARRREVIARARSLGLGLFGATDMHGLGYAATVWNVVPMAGWRGMDDVTLTREVLGRLREEPAANRVIAMRRRLAPTRAAQMIGVPLSLVTLLRTASRRHAAALLLWIWVPALLLSRSRRPHSP